MPLVRMRSPVQIRLSAPKPQGRKVLGAYLLPITFLLLITYYLFITSYLLFALTINDAISENTITAEMPAAAAVSPPKSIPIGP